MVPAVSRLPAAAAAEAQLAAADTLEPREDEELLDPSSMERLAILPENNKIWIMCFKFLQESINVLKF